MGGLFRSSNVTTRADLLTEFTYSDATYGETVPVILGTTKVSGNIIDYTDFTAHEHKHSQRTGKGGGSKQTNITYTYTVAVAIGLCEGPIRGIRRIWANKEVYNFPTSEEPFDLFTGSYGQKPWPYMVQKHPDRALPYSGLAYVAGVIDLGESSSMRSYGFEVQGQLLETGDGTDVNPADYILYILTDEKNGLGFSRNDIDLVSLDRARQYWAAADLLISSPKSGKSKKAQDVINSICELTGVYVFWSQNKLKFVPTCMDRLEHNGHVYEPNRTVMYDLTADDFLPTNNNALVTFERTDSSEAYNQANVEFTNRSNGYENETVSFEVTSDVLVRGLRPASKVTADYIYTKERALFVAQMLAKKYIYARNTYSFSLDWAFCRLEPGDLVSITDEDSGLQRKVVIITEIKEGADGELDVEAVSVPDGVYSSAQINVHNGERPFIDRGVKPASVNDVAMFQPSGELTANGLELWIGVHASNEHWGGCYVYASEDNEKYAYVGKLHSQARMGYLQDAISATDTTMNVTLQHGELLSGTQQDAERGNTIFWLDGELISYTTATLINVGLYRLEGCIRGQHNTVATAHGKGNRFVRLDNLLFKQPFKEEYIGRNMWFKFPSMNEFGANEERLENVQAFPYTVKAYYIPQVVDLSATVRYRATSSKGLPIYDIIVKVTPPNISSYDKTAIFFKRTMTDGTVESWQFAGYTGTNDGNTTLTIPQAVVGEQYVIKAVVWDKHGYTSDEANAITTRVTIQSKTAQPNVPQNFSIVFKETPVLSWDEVVNADVDYYELRTNDEAGNPVGLLLKVSATSTLLQLDKRAGTLYLFAHGRDGKYSYPATLEYRKDEPPVPTGVNVQSLLQGLSISCDRFTNGIVGMAVYIDGERYYATSNYFYYAGTSGIKRIQLAYVDAFGEGPMTAEILGTIEATIPPELIKQGSLSLKQMDDTVREAIENGSAELKEQFVQLVTDLNGDAKDSKYSAIAQTAKGLELRVKEDELISKINLSKETATIDARFIHITGDTKIDGNVITNEMLQAKSVTADKLKVESLSAVSSNLGTVTAGDISGVTIHNPNNSFRVDANGNVRGVNITASTIDANVIRQAGFRITDVDYSYFEFTRGWTPVPNGYQRGNCKYIPIFYIENMNRYKYDSGRWKLAKPGNFRHLTYKDDANNDESNALNRLASGSGIIDRINFGWFKVDGRSGTDKHDEWSAYAPQNFTLFNDGYGVFGGVDNGYGILGKGRILLLVKR